MTAVQAWRDLAWLLNSPPLLNPDDARFNGQVLCFTQEQLALINEWLSQLAEQLELLSLWLEQKPPLHLARLGRYAEHLIEFFLLHGPTHQLIAANVALRYPEDQRQGDHTTQGELDFLVHERGAGQYWHWELAVKYFLWVPANEASRLQPSVQDLEPSTWYGPDEVEVFSYKLQKIFGRQLRHRIPPPFDDRSWRAAALTRGWLFYPWNQEQIIPVMPWLHPEHLRGWWIRHQDLATLPPTWARFEILDRQRWLAKAQGQVCFSRDTLASRCTQRWDQLLAERQLPPSGILVAAIEENKNGETVERARFFVVPDSFAKQGIRVRQ